MTPLGDDANAPAVTDLKVLESRIIPYHQSVCATKPLAQLDVQTVCRSDNKKEAGGVRCEPKRVDGL